MRNLSIAALAVLVLASAGACSNSKSASQATSAPSGAAPSNAVPANAEGANVYTSTCSSCHGMTGKGVAGTFPPLAGNPAVTGDPKTLIHIVKYGLTGTVHVGTDTFNGMMPAWASQLSNGDVAAVVTYIRTSWGNSASAVTAADVSAVVK